MRKSRFYRGIHNRFQSFLKSMSVDEFPQESLDSRVKIFDTNLKRQCLDLLMKSGLPKDHVPRVIPPRISECLLNCLPQEASSALLSQSGIPNLFLTKDNTPISCETIKELLHSHTQVLGLNSCTLPCHYLSAKELLCALTEQSRLNTLTLEKVIIAPGDKKIYKILGTLMERVTCLRYISVYPLESVHQIDEIFAQFARDHLSKNRNLAFVDLRGSDIDLVATNSKRNLPINFAGEMRRWARRLKGLAFETDVSLQRVLRIINRQCPLLKCICIKARDQQTVSDVFDNLRAVLNSSDHLEQQNIEPLPKLKRLCLCGNFRVTDKILCFILPSVPALSFLNISGCPVNFEQYWMHLPSTLEELIIDECSRTQILMEHRSFVCKLLQKCPNLTIYISKPCFEDEDYQSLKGLALLHGAKCILNQNFDNFIPAEDEELIAFELRVIELDHKVPCINVF